MRFHRSACVPVRASAPAGDSGRMPVWVRPIALVLGTALPFAACGGGGEEAGPAETRPESTTTAPADSTTTAPAESTTAAPPSPPEAALLAEAADLFADRPGRDEEVLDTSRALCGALDEAAGAQSSTAATFTLMAMFRSMGDEAATVLARLAAEHLCPQHTATVEGFIASRPPSGL